MTLSKQRIRQLSVEDSCRAVREGSLAAREVAEAYLESARQREPEVHAFLRLEPQEVLQQAELLDERIRKGEAVGPLAGLPVAVKDVIVTRGTPTTCGSRILENYRPPYDATVIERLREAGALVFGKTNCDEFAMGSSTENSAYFPTRNPWDNRLVPGGSSGGSAACVAAGQAPVALGTDTGGSIRQPAAFCGLVGLKPTYGRVSRYGLVAFASSLDQIGPLARNVREAALLLNTIAGHDHRDSTSAPLEPEDFTARLGRDLKGLRVGVPQEWMGEGLQPEIRHRVEFAMRQLEDLGCRLDPVHLPHNRYAIATYYIIAPAEASSNLARYDGVRYGFRATGGGESLEAMYRATRSSGFGREVKRRIMLGTYVLSAGYYDAYFVKAARVRRLIRQDLDQAFEKVQLLLGPTTPSPPFALGEKLADPLQMYLSDVFTVTANLAGIPGINLPAGSTSEGLPVGIQLLAPHFQESRLLQAAYALEQVLGVGRGAWDSGQ